MLGLLSATNRAHATPQRLDRPRVQPRDAARGKIRRRRAAGDMAALAERNHVEAPHTIGVDVGLPAGVAARRAAGRARGNCAGAAGDDRRRTPGPCGAAGSQATDRRRAARAYAALGGRRARLAADTAQSPLLRASLRRLWRRAAD